MRVYYVATYIHTYVDVTRTCPPTSIHLADSEEIWNFFFVGYVYDGVSVENFACNTFCFVPDDKLLFSCCFTSVFVGVFAYCFYGMLVQTNLYGLD